MESSIIQKIRKTINVVPVNKVNEDTNGGMDISNIKALRGRAGYYAEH